MASTLFDPPLALASLSGESDAEWARAGAADAGAAFLGGIALDDSSRDAARELVARGRSEFLPPDPVAFVDDQFASLASVPIRPAINVRSTSVDPIVDVVDVCRRHDALLEINAHCRQDELRDVGCGESLLRDTDRLCDYVRTAAADRDVPVGVKVRAELAGVDLATAAERIEAAGASFVHVDAMDTESVVADVAGASDLFVIANNGVRDEQTVAEYVDYGADAVSIGRPSDDETVRDRVATAVEAHLGSGRRPVRTDG